MPPNKEAFEDGETKMKILWLFLVILTTGCSHPSLSDDDFSKEVVRATPISSSLFFLEGAGGNMTALIGPGGTFLVDDDFEPMADKILSKLRELGGGAPRFIVNTHFHYDHTGGNLVFGSTATIIAASAVRERLMTEQTLWKKQHPAMPLRAWSSLTFDHALSLHFNGEDPEIVHFPSAHTDGDTVVFFPHNRAVSMGIFISPECIRFSILSTRGV